MIFALLSPALAGGAAADSGQAHGASPAPGNSGSKSSGRASTAVLPFAGEDIDPEKLAEATRRFRTELASTDSFRLVSQGRVEELLRQSRDSDLAECGNTPCSQVLGRKLDVESVFTGVVSQEVETWRLEVSRTDTRTGKATFDHLIEVYGSFDDLLKQGCPRMARIACGRDNTDNNYTVLEGGGSGHAWPWVVGGLAVAAGGATAAVLLLMHGGSSQSTPAPPPDQLIVKW